MRLAAGSAGSASPDPLAVIGRWGRFMKGKEKVGNRKEGKGEGRQGERERQGKGKRELERGRGSELGKGR